MKKQTSPLAKLTAPGLPKVVERSRLFRLLDDFRKDYPIIWVTAPAGFGKTTLVASYLKARKLKALWYQLDAGDDDPATFFYYMALGVKKSAPQFRKPLLRLTPQFLPSLSLFTRRFFEQIYLRHKPPFCFVFDNYQEIPTQSKFHEFFLKGLQALPQGLMTLIISRMPPPADFAHLLANQNMTVLESSDLLLTWEETRNIINLQAEKSKGTGLSKALVDFLVDKSQGWVAGLVLFLEWAMKKEEAPYFDKGEMPGTVIDYFAKEVMTGFSQSEQEILMRISCFPRMTETMAERLTKSESAGRILKDLHRKCQLLERYFDKESIFQFHSLFREFLQTQANQYFSRKDLRAIKNHAARLLEEDGKFELAISLFEEANCEAEKIRSITTLAPTLYSQGRLQTLAKFLGNVSLEQRKANPWLSYWLAKATLGLYFKQGYVLYEEAFHQFHQQGNIEGKILAWCGAVEGIMYYWGDFTPLKAWLQKWSAVDLRKWTSLSAEIQTSLGQSFVRALNTCKPDSPAWKMWVERTLKQANLCTDPIVRFSGYNTIFMAYAWMGDIKNATNLRQKIASVKETNALAPLEQMKPLIGETLLAWWRGDDEELQHAIQKMEKIERDMDTPGLFGRMLTEFRLWRALLVNDDQTIQAEVRGLDFKNQDMPPLLGGHNRYLKGWIAWLEGKLTESWDHVNEAVSCALKYGGPFQQVQAHLAAAQILFELNQVEEALVHLDQGETIGNRVPSPRLQMMLKVVKAHLSFEQQDVSGGSQALREAFQMGCSHDLGNFFWWHPKIMAKLCARALEADIEVPYVKQLIIRRKLTQESTSVQSDLWPWPVKLDTMGVFSVELYGVSLAFTRKVPRRPLALLKVLIALGGQHIPTYQICDALWPDSDGDAAYISLNTALARLRKILKDETFIMMKDGKLSLNDEKCVLDYKIFESTLDQADQAVKEQNVPKAVGLVSKALSLYRGPFLAGEPEESWLFPIRTRLKNQYLSHVFWLADYWAEQNNLEEALKVLTRAVKAEPTEHRFSERLETTLHPLYRDKETRKLSHR